MLLANVGTQAVYVIIPKPHCFYLQNTKKHWSRIICHNLEGKVLINFVLLPAGCAENLETQSQTIWTSAKVVAPAIDLLNKVKRAVIIYT